jgi:hypothetical protein
MLEEALLTGPSQDLPTGGIDPRASDALRERHAQEERDIGELIRGPHRRAATFVTRGSPGRSSS